MRRLIKASDKNGERSQKVTLERYEEGRVELEHGVNR